MQNSYIIDILLSGLACVMLLYAYISIKLRLTVLNRLMSANDMAAALGQLIGRSVLFSMPFITLFLFCLWRSYHLMLFTQTWGNGGIGLLAAVAVIGVPTIWLFAMLICIYHSGFARPSSRPAPPPQPNMTGEFYDKQQ